MKSDRNSTTPRHHKLIYLGATQDGVAIKGMTMDWWGDDIPKDWRPLECMTTNDLEALRREMEAEGRSE